MVVAAGFIQRAEVAKAFLGPELSAAFEATLFLTAGRFDRPRTDGPSAFCNRLVVHPTGMGFEVVLFAPDHLASFTASLLESRNLAQGLPFLAVPHLVPERLDPLCGLTACVIAGKPIPAGTGYKTSDNTDARPSVGC